MKPYGIPPRAIGDIHQWRAGRKRGEQRATIKILRRIVIEDHLFPPDGLGDMPKRFRLQPQGVQAVRWLVEFFEKLARTKLQYPLGGRSESTIRRDITAILKERKSK